MKKIIEFFKNSKYRVFLLIYSFVLVMLITAALSVLWTYLSKYEEYMPEKTMDTFISETDAEYWGQLLQNRYSEKTTEFEKTDDVISLLEFNDIDISSLTYYKSVKDFTDEHPTYNVYYKNKEFAVVSLKSVREVYLGLCEWEIDSVSLSIKDEQANSVSVSVTVPPETVVKANGITVGDSYITSNRVEYKNISEFEHGLDGVPYRVKYTISGLYGMPLINAFDTNGNELPVDIAQYDFFVGAESTLNNSVEIIVPKDYSVYLNDVKAGEAYVKNADYGYSLLNDVKGFTGNLPSMYLYLIDGLFLEPQIKVFDENGNEVALKESKDGTFTYDLQADNQAKQTHEQIAIDFVKAYFKYTGDGRSNIAQNHADLLSYMLSGSSADDYIRGSYWGVYYNNTYKITHNLLDASNFIVYDENCFSCDLKYNTDFNLYNYNKHYEGSFKLVFVKQGEQFKLSKMVIN